MAYFEGEVPIVTTGNGYGNNGGFFGNDGIWAILLLALLGFGRGGYGLGGGGSAGSEFVGYELGKTATQADIASGFNNSAVLSSLNDLKLGQANGFANVQQTLCQGFSGVNTAILQSANATERGFATLGYNLANCCCDIKGAIADAKYANEKQTYDIVVNQNNNTQRIIDYLTTKENQNLRDENFALRLSASQAKQNAYLLNEIKPCPIPAYITCNPNTGLTYPQGYTNTNFGGNGCNGCGF